MSGTQLSESTLKHVVFENCRLDYATFNGVRAAAPVAWTDCNLDHAELTQCRLPGVAIRSCSLRDLELDDCDLRGADLRGSDLSQVSGLRSFREVRLAEDQVTGLATAMVRELGITVLADESLQQPPYPQDG